MCKNQATESREYKKRIKIFDFQFYRKSTSPRVVFVASIGHHWGKIDFDTLEEPDNEFVTSQFRAYTQSKLASVLTARELHKREHKNGISVFALQPGNVYVYLNLTCHPTS